MPSILKNRVNFASAKKTPEYPDFLDIQIKSFQDFFQLETKSANGQKKVSLIPLKRISHN